ncbi:MAG: carbohydrate kinase [Planctomycetes bacterium]|nr:carbohydrate kinase [Planctomycetota bacterium]
MNAEVHDAVLALDLGTSSAKAVLVGRDGRTLARAEKAIETFRPAPEIAEQDADAALQAARTAVAELSGACGGRPRALALACAMHGVLPIDALGRPLARLRTWADARGDDVARELRASDAWRALQERTGTPVHASSPLCKLAAWRREDQALFARAAAFVSLKELLLRRVCDANVVDVSLASATGLMDLRTRDWDEAALAVAGVTRGHLSRVVGTRQLVSSWRTGAAESFGLDPRTPVVVGASDGCLANLGLDAIRPGLAAASLGTSAALRAAVTRPGMPADSGLFCYALDDGIWIAGGATNAAGNLLEWLADRFYFDQLRHRRIDVMLDDAGRSDEGANGVRCTAAFAGTRFPDYDARPRGAFTGLSFAHGRADLVRAALESIADGIAAIAAALRAQGMTCERIRIGGGLARAPLVRHVLASRLGAALEPVGDDARDATALGAATLAFAALDGAPLRVEGRA